MFSPVTILEACEREEETEHEEVAEKERKMFERSKKSARKAKRKVKGYRTEEEGRRDSFSVHDRNRVICTTSRHKMK